MRHFFVLAMALLVIPARAQEASSRFAFQPGDLRLEAVPGHVSLRYQDEDHLRAVLQRRELGLTLEAQLPFRRRAVVRVDPDQTTALIQGLRGLPGLDEVHAVWGVDGRDDEVARYLLTDELVVAWAPTLDHSAIQSALRSEGLYWVADIGFLPNAMRVRVTPGDDAWLAARRLALGPQVRFAHADWLRKLAPRETIPNDPLFGNLWQLKNTGQGGGLVGADTRATLAWDWSLGSGTRIAVIDTGVDENHIDLNVQSLGFNPWAGPGVGHGSDVGTHGTSCAGVAAAKGMNGALIAGMAPAALVLPIQLIVGAGFGTPTEEAACFAWAVDAGADVITNSWGPDGVPFPLPQLVEQVFVYCHTSGRAGRGCPIFWAAGNGNESVASDAYVSSPFTIAIGASTNFDQRASYSDFGPALDLMAPSSGGSRGINTTTPNNGWTLVFGGTSAAAPCAAGVAALMLSAAPELTSAQVAGILKSTAANIQPATANYDALGHSLHYGHGRLDAEAAVLAAIAAAGNTPRLQIVTSGFGNIQIGIDHLDPLSEFLMAFSQQLYQPIGSGPLFGVGQDSVQTLAAAPGIIPFHFWADAQGGFFWGAYGIPPGLTVQAVVISVTGPFSWKRSNVVQVAF
ncbi:MAG: S8 family serine peptidase [Rhodocyclaceae bacterium]|nr:S8 family serine peptidase [Rhodocyclaceae bacterium]